VASIAATQPNSSAPKPLAFVAALRMLLDSWMRNESVERK
jgi:hypothetical protein